MNCNLFENMASGHIYLVINKERVNSPGIFTCYHCAELWGKQKFHRRFEILSFKTDIQFISEFMNKMADIIQIHYSNHSATERTLNKIESKC